MVRYARGLAERGLDVVTFNFPYMQARRKSQIARRCSRTPSGASSPAPSRIVTSRATRLFIGGKSMGGRMATHLAAAPESWPADAPPLTGVVVFGYPLQPPGGSTRSPDRVSHLLAIRVPTLIVQGTRDTFGGPDDIAAALRRQARPPITVTPLPAAITRLSPSRRRRSTALEQVVAQSSRRRSAFGLRPFVGSSCQFLASRFSSRVGLVQLDRRDALAHAAG